MLGLHLKCKDSKGVDMKCIYKQLGITIWETNIRSASGTRRYVQFAVSALFYVYITLQLKRAFLKLENK